MSPITIQVTSVQNSRFTEHTLGNAYKQTLRASVMQTDLFCKKMFHNVSFGYDQCFLNSTLDKPRTKITEKKIKGKQMSLTLHDVIHIVGKQFHYLVRIQMKPYTNLILKRGENCSPS